MAGARLPGAVPSTAHLDCPAPELGQWQRGARCRARATGQQSARDRRVAKNEVTWVHARAQMGSSPQSWRSDGSFG